MRLDFCWVEPEEVSTTDETFRVRSLYPQALAASIRDAGVRTPLLVQKIAQEGEARYRLVSGWGRWLETRRGRPLPCFLLPAERTEDELWNDFLRDNDRWNVLEIARILRRLSALPDASADDIVRDRFRLIGLRPSKDLYRAHLRLLDLPPSVQEFIECEGLPLRRAGVFFKLPLDALAPIVEAVRRLALSLNEIAEVLELIEETARRDGSRPLDVLTDALAGQAVERKRLFLERLRERRYPQLSRYREQLRVWREELDFSMPVRIEWDPQLERPGLRLTADLADADALEALERELNDRHMSLRRFFDIL